MRLIEVEFRRGVYLPEAELWLDPHDPQEIAFVSHAHSDHVAPHRHVICSETTRLLIEKRFGRRGEMEGHALKVPFERGGFRFEMLSAGHILGSAQLRVERIEDGASLLYTGDFKLRHGISSDPAEARVSDTLIMETTYGLPRYTMPPGDEVVARLVRWVREAMEDNHVPVLGAYALGKAQEILLAIGNAAPELKFLLYPTAAEMTRIYGELGYELPPCEVLRKESSVDGHVLIVPPNVLRAQQIRGIKNRLTAMVTGWGLDPGAKFRFQVDEVFPLSDHADYTDLLRYVEMVRPKQVLTLHGFAEEFSRDLRERGYEAWALTADNQLELGLGAVRPEASTTVELESPAATEGEFGAFAALCDAIAQSTGKLRKINLLANYFAGLNEKELGIATVFLTGRAFGPAHEMRALNTGWAVIRRALLEASARTEAEARQLTAGQNEAGRAAFLILEGRTNPEPFALVEIREHFRQLAAASGPVAKTRLLREQMARLHPAQAQYLVKILTGDLRIGLKEGLIEEAIAEAFQAPSNQVRYVHMLLGDLGETAKLASRGELENANITCFIPIKCMLASPEETAEDLWARLGEGRDAIWLEDKFDGIRAQLHRRGDHVEIFSRDLRPLHEEFRELTEPATKLGADVILDGEIIAYAEGKKLTFFDLQKRLGRMEESDLFFGPSIPVRFVAFDVLWHNDVGLLERPLRERREILESLSWNGALEPLVVRKAASAREVEAAFKDARLRGNEGLIAKDPESTYSPGRRGLSWLKLKKPMSTLDVVVVKVEEGHGKRSHVLSDYTFAVRDTRTGELSVIGKAYSGLTDQEIEELTEHFKEHTISTGRHSRVVEPNVVLEIAFDSIQPSKRHGSGLALRFPRIKAIRTDKTVEEIDTLDYARRLAGLTDAVPAES